jgi:hypothetical protein
VCEYVLEGLDERVHGANLLGLFADLGIECVDLRRERAFLLGEVLVADLVGEVGLQQLAALATYSRECGGSPNARSDASRTLCPPCWHLHPSPHHQRSRRGAPRGTGGTQSEGAALQRSHPRRPPGPAMWAVLQHKPICAAAYAACSTVYLSPYCDESWSIKPWQEKPAKSM